MKGLDQKLINRCIEHYLEYKNACVSSEVSNFKRMSPDKAIRVASLATSEAGIRFSHQRRLSRNALESAHQNLSRNISQIISSKSFEELLLFIEKRLALIKGLGPLYCYDTALRIGASLKLFPEKVYLHSGTLEGALALGIVTRGQKALEKKDIPEVFSKLNIYEIEDVLCIYKSCFRSGKFEISSSMEKCCLK